MLKWLTDGVIAQSRILRRNSGGVEFSCSSSRISCITTLTPGSEKTAGSSGGIDPLQMTANPCTVRTPFCPVVSPPPPPPPPRQSRHDQVALPTLTSGDPISALRKLCTKRKLNKPLLAMDLCRQQTRANAHQWLHVLAPAWMTVIPKSIPDPGPFNP